MKEIRFVGVHLAEQYRTQYKSLLGDIHKIAPSVKQVKPEFTHMSLVYLQGRFADDIILDEIATIIQSRAAMLRGANLHIGGVGFFGKEDNPTSVFLRVSKHQSLVDFNQALEGMIAKPLIRKRYPFYPHMEVLRLQSPNSKRCFLSKKQLIEERLDAVDWSIPITEVGIFGYDHRLLPCTLRELKKISVESRSNLNAGSLIQGLRNILSRFPGFRAEMLRGRIRPATTTQ